MSEIQLIPFEQNKDSQTFRDCVRLMKANFSDPSATNSDSIDWLYLKNPYKKAIGYIAYDGKKPVSQLYMIFQQINHGNKKRNIGILSNLCTEKEYRNRGLFNRLVSQLLNDAKQFNIPFVWAYPNPSSLHGFKKAGFQIVKNLSFEISPVSYFSFAKEFLRKEKITVLGETEEVPGPKIFTGFQEINAIKKEITFSHQFHTPLDQVQLNWRYLNHPNRKYYTLKHIKTDEIIIIRLVKIFGFKAAVIMKQSTYDSNNWNKIIFDLRLSLKKTCSLILNISNTEHSATDIFCNRFIIPKKLSPRTFPLAIYPLEPISMKAENFIFSFGDYEAL